MSFGGVEAFFSNGTDFARGKTATASSILNSNTTASGPQLLTSGNRGPTRSGLIQSCALGDTNMWALVNLGQPMNLTYIVICIILNSLLDKGIG